MTGKRAQPDAKDPATFRDYARDVRPLAGRRGRVPPPASRDPETAAGSRRADTPIFDVRDDGQSVEGARRGFENLLDELARGRYPIASSLDLHRLSSDESRKRLLHFCKAARGRDRRAVLIIHGKGTHSPGGRGILRDDIAEWLSSAPIAEHVLCFVTARERHGGAGAVYVLVAPRR